MKIKLAFIFLFFFNFLGYCLGSPEKLSAELEKPALSYRDDAASQPVFSHSAGWYTDGFQLTLSSSEPEAELYYTLDGTEPSKSSKRYTQPIAIRDRSNEANALSTKATSTNLVRPTVKVFKATTIRARAYVGDAMSRVSTKTFLIAPGGSARYDFPVISLVLDPADFFDYEKGIYVLGKIYKEQYNSSLPSWEQAANYSQSGSEWERPAFLELFENDGKLALAQNVGVRIHGGATRSNPQKSLRIYARDVYKGDDKNFNYELFPGLSGPLNGKPITEFRRFILRNSGNDGQYTFFRDALMTSLVEGTKLDIQDFRPAIVLINGEYWGIHNIRERFDEYYIKNAYGVDKDDVVILENNGSVDVGEKGDEKPYHDLVAYLNSHDMSVDENYRHIQTLMDVDNFIEYQIAQIYFSNTDWPGNNLKFWRIRADTYDPNAGVSDGRWRWFLYDTDFGFGLYKGPEAAEHRTLDFALQAGLTEWPNPDWATFILRTLLDNENFRASFINRFADRLNANFEPSFVKARIDEFTLLYEKEMAEHIQRWRMPQSVDQWRWNISALKTFAERRSEAMRRQIEEKFKIDRYQLALSWEAERGRISVNSLSLDTGESRLVYFSSIPIVLSAKAESGFRFAGWRLSDEASGTSENIQDQAALTLSLRSNTSLVALFEPLE